MSDNKVNIFDVLNKLSEKDSSFYDQLSDEQKKSVHPYVVMKWLTGTSNAKQVFFVNELVNTKVFAFSRHPKLLYQLMTVCTSGNKSRYYWNKGPTKSSGSDQAIEVIRQYFNYSTTHAKQALPLLNSEQIIDYAHQLGWSKEQITKLNKQLKSKK